MKKNKFEFESEATREKFINEIIGYFETEMGQEIGIIAAGNILDFFVDLMGPEFYKKGIGDAKKLLRQKLADLDIELDSL